MAAELLPGIVDNFPKHVRIGLRKVAVNRSRLDNG
jgi:hypothetical protein